MGKTEIPTNKPTKPDINQLPDPYNIQYKIREKYLAIINMKAKPKQEILHILKLADQTWGGEGNQFP